MPLLISLHNINSVNLLQDNSLQLKPQFTIVATMNVNVLIRMMQNANFSNFRTTFKAQAVRISEK